jgi:hypothetical protein
MTICFLSRDGDIQNIENVKGCLFPWFCCRQTHHRPNQMQIDMTTTKDWLIVECTYSSYHKHLSAATHI